MVVHVREGSLLHSLLLLFLLQIKVAPDLKKLVENIPNLNVRKVIPSKCMYDCVCACDIVKARSCTVHSLLSHLYVLLCSFEWAALFLIRIRGL